MHSTETLFALLISSLAFAYVPGPALVYAAAQTIAHGRRAGLMAAFGIHLGGYAHVLAVALGVAVIVDQSPQLFTAIKVLGVCYLFWLGGRLLLLKPDEVDEVSGSRNEVLSQSVMVEVFNPTTAIFFLAFLPQFVDFNSDLPVWLQLAILGAIVNAVFSSVELLCVLFSSQVVDVLCSENGTGNKLQRIGGFCMIAIGLNLAMTGS